MKYASPHGPSYGLFSACDLAGYSGLQSHVQRDQQRRLHEVIDRAARVCKLPLEKADLQPTGDGHLIRWPADTSVLDLVASLPLAMAIDLNMINETLAPAAQMRLRLAIAGGVSEPASYGYAGRPPVVVSRLLNSHAAHEALRAAGDLPLVLILTDAIFEDVVLQGHRGLRKEDFIGVTVQEKEYTGQAWISAPGADFATLTAIAAGIGSPPAGDEAQALPPDTAPSPPRRARALATPVVPAAIGGAATIIAATIGAILTWGPPAGFHQNTATGRPIPTSSVTPGSPTPAPSPGRGRWEQVDNHSGVQTFLDNRGTTSGRGSIPYATKVRVACLAPNESSLGSVNAFYRISGGTWSGLYAPADVFANGDKLGSAGTHDVDPSVPQCPDPSAT